MQKQNDTRTLYLNLPRLPRWSIDTTADAWIDEILWINCGSRLMELHAEGQLERHLLESCSINQDGRSYRIQLRKGIILANGDELTAEDAIDSLLRVAASPYASSQLGLILRYKGADAKRSFQIHSRHRFEILLKETVSDLLERLALPECWIHKKSHVHISVGDWQVQSSQGDRLILAPQHGAKDRREAHYTSVDIQVLDQTGPIEGHDDRARLSMFPGTLRKAPATNALSETHNFATRPQLLFGIWLYQSIRDRATLDTVRFALQGFARLRSVWRKHRLTQLFHQHAFACEVPAVESSLDPLPSRLYRTICYDPASVAPALLEDLSAYLEHRWHIQFKFVPQAAASQASDGVLFAWLESSPGQAAHSLERALNQSMTLPLEPEALILSLQKLKQEVQTGRRAAIFRDFLSKLVQHPQFLPVTRTPLLVHGNVAFVEEATARGTLRFIELGGPVHKQKAIELRQESVSAIGAAVQMLAHDIKRPFGRMEALLDLLSKNDDPERIRQLAREYLPEVRRISYAVKEMIADILEMGSNLELVTEPVSPAQVLEECLRLLPPPGQQIELRWTWQHRLMLEGDSTKITRILTNLVTNALQATPEGGRIEITTRELQEGPLTWIEIGVHNTGSYIPPEKRERIFEAFFTEGKDHGTGLGLAIVQKLVLSHNGQIRCESHPEKGTSFVVSIPASYRTDERPEQRQAHLDQLWQQLLDRVENKRPFRLSTRILMVDDDPIDVANVRELLNGVMNPGQTLDFRVVKTYREAALYLQTSWEGVILLDYQLGEENGLQLLPKLKLLAPRARILLQSHLWSPELEKLAGLAGADACEPKPLRIETLQRLLPTETEAVSVIIIEDDPIYRDIWLAAGGKNVRSFASPEDLEAALKKNPRLFEGCLAVISDAMFEGSSSDGLSFLAQLRERLPKLPLYLCSHAPPESVWPSVEKEPQAITEFMLRLLGRPESG
jgi:signal transduction histidine kinase